MLRFSFLLQLLLVFTSTPAQVLYEEAIQPFAGTITSMMTLTDGNILTAGAKDSELHLIKWNTVGDTIWTRHHAGTPGAFPNSLAALSTGEIRVVTIGQEHFLDQNGEILWSNALVSGNYQTELGEDSLLYTIPSGSAQQFQLRDRQGNVIWTSDPLVYYGDVIGSYTIATATETGIVAYTLSNPNIQSMFDYGVLRSLYAADGSFQDSTLVHYAWNGQIAFTTIMRTADGGSLCIFSTGSTGFMVVRADASGNGLWMEQHGMSFEYTMQARDVVELADGRFILSGHSLDLNDMTNHPCLIEISSGGDHLCTEYLTAGEPLDTPPWTSGYEMTRTADDEVHLVVQDALFNPTEQSLFGHGPVYCLSTSLPERHTAQVLMEVSPGLLRIKDTQAGHTWSIHNTHGALIASGSTQQGSTQIPFGHRGMYLLTIHGAQASTAKFLME